MRSGSAKVSFGRLVGIFGFDFQLVALYFLHICIFDDFPMRLFDRNLKEWPTVESTAVAKDACILEFVTVW